MWSLEGRVINYVVIKRTKQRTSGSGVEIYYCTGSNHMQCCQLALLGIRSEFTLSARLICEHDWYFIGMNGAFYWGLSSILHLNLRAPFGCIDVLSPSHTGLVSSSTTSTPSQQPWQSWACCTSLLGTWMRLSEDWSLLGKGKWSRSDLCKHIAWNVPMKPDLGLELDKQFHIGYFDFEKQHTSGPVHCISPLENLW